MPGIFRERALKKMSSPEQLDQLIRLTSLRQWIALLTVGVVLLCFVWWGIFGSVPTRVSGQGILIRAGGGIVNIVSPSAGIVQDLYFGVGDYVQGRESVATLSKSSVLEQLKTARSHLLNLQEKYRLTAQFDTENLRLQKESLQQQRQIREQQNENERGKQRYWEERASNQVSLVAQGLITRHEYFNSQQELQTARRSLESGQNELKRIELEEKRMANQQQQELLDLQMQIDQAKRSLAELEHVYRSGSLVGSPNSGRVIETAINEGASVNQGDVIMSIELPESYGEGLEASLYFQPADGKRIHPGMAVQIVPSTVKREEYGSVKGTVTYVSEFPASRHGVSRFFANPDLIASFFAHGAPIMVKARLLADAGSPSGYRWSSGKGPDMKIADGTYCQATVIVEEQAPIRLIIPYFKKTVLGIGEEEVQR